MFRKPDSIIAAVRIGPENFQNSPIHRAIYYSGHIYTGGGQVDLWVPVTGNDLIVDTDTSDIVFGNGWVDVVEGINRKMNAPNHFTYLVQEFAKLHVGGLPLESLKHTNIDITGSGNHLLDKKDPSYSIYESIKNNLPEIRIGGMNRREPYLYSNSKLTTKFVPLATCYKHIPEFCNIYSEKESYEYEIIVLHHGGPRSLRLFNPKMLTGFGYAGEKNPYNEEQLAFLDQHLPTIRDLAKSGKEINPYTTTAGFLGRSPSYAICIYHSNKFTNRSYSAEFGLVYDSKNHTIIYSPKKVKTRTTYYSKGRGNREVKKKLEDSSITKDKLWHIGHRITSLVGDELFSSIFTKKEGWDPRCISQSNLEHLLYFDPEIKISSAIKELDDNKYSQELYGITYYCDKRKLHDKYLKNKKLFTNMKEMYQKIAKFSLGQLLYYEENLFNSNVLTNDYMALWWVYKSVVWGRIVKLNIKEFHKDFAISYSSYLQVVKEKERKKAERLKRQKEKADKILAAALQISKEKQGEIANVS